MAQKLKYFAPAGGITAGGSVDPAQLFAELEQKVSSLQSQGYKIINIVPLLMSNISDSATPESILSAAAILCEK